jgi:hypothetical protein
VSCGCPSHDAVVCANACGNGDDPCSCTCHEDLIDMDAFDDCPPDDYDPGEDERICEGGWL